MLGGLQISTSSRKTCIGEGKILPPAWGYSGFVDIHIHIDISNKFIHLL